MGCNFHRPAPQFASFIAVVGNHAFDRKPSGKAAHQRLRTYIGSPKEIKTLEKIQFENAKIRKTPSNYTVLGELCRVIGWTE